MLLNAIEQITKACQNFKFIFFHKVYTNVILNNSSPININGIWLITFFHVNISLIELVVKPAPLIIFYIFPLTIEERSKNGIPIIIHLKLKRLYHSVNSSFKIAKEITPIKAALNTTEIESNILCNKYKKD